MPIYACRVRYCFTNSAVHLSCCYCVETNRWALRSAVTNRLTVPAVKLSMIGSRVFSVSGPHMWNQLPEEITCAASLSTFQRHI